MENKRLKLPIGIHTFEELRKDSGENYNCFRSDLLDGLMTSDCDNSV